MKLKATSTFSLLALLPSFLTAQSTQAQSSLGRIEIGRPFPAGQFPTLETEPQLSVADFRGKPVVLLIFASW